MLEVISFPDDMGTGFMLVLLMLEKLDGKLEYFRFLAIVLFLSFASSSMSRQTKVCLTILVKLLEKINHQ